MVISHLYQSPFNRDKKLLAFTDSVQDASHRAGFFGARTYRFNLRTAIQAVLEAEPTGVIRLDEFTDRLLAYWGQRMDLPRLVAAFVPPDLRDLPEYREFMQKPTDRPEDPRAAEEAAVVGSGDGVRLQRPGRSDARQGSLLDGPAGRGPAHGGRGQTAHDADQRVRPTERIDAGPPAAFRRGPADPHQGPGRRVARTAAGLRRQAGPAILPVEGHEPAHVALRPHSRLPRFLSDLPNENVFDSVITSGNRRNWYSRLGAEVSVRRP